MRDVRHSHSDRRAAWRPWVLSFVTSCARAGKDSSAAALERRHRVGRRGVHAGVDDQAADHAPDPAGRAGHDAGRRAGADAAGDQDRVAATGGTRPGRSAGRPRRSRRRGSTGAGRRGRGRARCARRGRRSPPLNSMSGCGVGEHAFHVALGEGREHRLHNIHVTACHESVVSVARIAILEGRMAAPAANIRNFSIIAHIDHGKSTLADRILEITGAVDPRDHRPQLLDSMDLERERGITIKAQAVRVEYTAKDGKLYRLHLIDTPGHVDFTYEVSRSLAACDGALLLVDASPGRRGADGRQHLPGGRRRPGADPGAQQDRPARRRARARGRRDPRAARARTSVLRVSAKSGDGVDRAARGDRRSASRRRRATPTQPARALIFDSEFDPYRGVVAYLRVVDGALQARATGCSRCRPAPRPTPTRSASSART